MTEKDLIEHLKLKFIVKNAKINDLTKENNMLKQQIISLIKEKESINKKLT